MSRNIAPLDLLGKIRECKGVKIVQISPATTGTLWTSDNPYVIWPYYTGRDKGALGANGGEANGALLAFYSEGRAWKHIFDSVQPNDPRACDNYRVVRLSEYLKS